MKNQILFASVVVAAVTVGHLSHAERTGAEQTITNCFNYAKQIGDGSGWNISGMSCVSSIPTLGVSALLSTTSNAIFDINLAQADLLARKALSGSQITPEEKSVLESALKEFAEKQIITAEAAGVSEKGLTAEQLNLIVGIAGSVNEGK